jgi:Uma2 family endonuclease
MATPRATIVGDETTAFEPDAVARCEAPGDPGGSTADAPMVVVEVISPSSRGIDANRKLGGYVRLPNVRRCLVLDPVRPIVLHHRRDEDERIEMRRLTEGRLQLEPPGLTVERAGLFVGLS